MKPTAHHITHERLFGPDTCAINDPCYFRANDRDPYVHGTMKRITYPPCHIAVLQNQELHRAREIIRNRADHSTGAEVIVTRNIARLSPHQCEIDMARAGLASMKVAA